MIVVATIWRKAVPYEGILLDARKPLMIRNFTVRLNKEQRHTHYNVIIDYAQNAEIDEFILAYAHWNFTPILYGANVLQPGIPAALAAHVTLWLSDAGRPVERRFIQCNPELRAALHKLGLDETSLGNAEAINRAYRRLCVSAHPDRGGSVAEFQRILEAYALLQRDAL